MKFGSPALFFEFRPQRESRDRLVNCLDRNRSFLLLPRRRRNRCDPLPSFLIFPLRPTFLSLRASPPTASPTRESCGAGIRRVGSSIFRAENRKNILKDPRGLSRGSKGGRRGFLIPRFALNSTSRCHDGDSALKNASRVELRGGKVGQCVDDANEGFVCIKLCRNKLEPRCRETTLSIKHARRHRN